MSEKKKYPQKSGASAAVATVIVAIAAVAAIVFLVMMNKNPSTGAQKLPDGTVVTFKPTQELADECGAKAQELISDNYRIVRLFISEGLPYLDEPYGNRPEDGAYTVDSDEYKTFEQVESFVKSVYTEEEANRILTQMPSDPSALFQSGTSEESEEAVSSQSSQETSEDISVPEFIAVYKSRDVYVDIPVESSEVTMPKIPEVVIPNSSTSEESGEESQYEPPKPSEPTYTKESVLGINEFFKPYTEYNKPWGSISLKIIPINGDECHITVYLGANKDINLSSVGENDILNTKMIRENGEWKLTELVY